MYKMFYNARTFNQDISGWNVSQVTDSYQFSKLSPLQNANKPSF